LNIVVNGVLMIVYMFIVIACYLFLSTPFDDMVSGFEDVNSTATDAKVEDASSMARTVFNMIFACLILAPIVWFIMWCFKREPGEEYYRRY